ncbi:cobyric acid synthase [Litoribrevibacter euphylliae]|uniref:Cobyric acid synthase n=1 Tax=Litoribrevibacter euphylliae TaxID=1834034 RepID=A0ABV7HHQ9_9GAMM
MAFKSPHTLMVQGTTSDAGKSILVTAICRILAQHNISVAPFKPQNMALNSAVTADGGEIGRAQAVQAEACYLEPTVLMNPVLLKPNSDVGAQVIVRGKAIGNMKAKEYHLYKPELLNDVVACHDELAGNFQSIIVEGAGSPAEINLREHDIANMGFAEAADCPVIIVADIDRGGVFAHLYGTYALLSESEQQRVKGFVINRFRGDVSLLEPGLDWLKEKTGVPVLGVIPYLHDLHIEAEDSLARSQQSNDQSVENKLKIIVPMYPRASNHTDFDVLRMHPDVDCQFARTFDDLDGHQKGSVPEADLIILPGSKSVRDDLQWLKDNGWDTFIRRHLRYGGKVYGICGGYQMLGRWIHDPKAIESAAGSSEGLGLLDIESTLTPNKTLTNVTGKLLADASKALLGQEVEADVQGYEIHAGVSKGDGLFRALFELHSNREDQTSAYLDGAITSDGQVAGSYVHGVFDQLALLDFWLRWASEGLDFQTSRFDYQAYKDKQINRLADAVEAAIPIDCWKALLSLPLKPDQATPETDQIALESDKEKA